MINYKKWLKMNVIFVLIVKINGFFFIAIHHEQQHSAQNNFWSPS